MDDLLPRADISGAIAGAVGMLGSANWKERKEALDEIEAALAGAGGRIQPNVRRGFTDRSTCMRQRCSAGNSLRPSLAAAGQQQHRHAS